MTYQHLRWWNGGPAQTSSVAGLKPKEASCRPGTYVTGLEGVLWTGLPALEACVFAALLAESPLGGMLYSNLADELNTWDVRRQQLGFALVSGMSVGALLGDLDMDAAPAAYRVSWFGNLSPRHTPNAPPAVIQPAVQRRQQGPGQLAARLECERRHQLQLERELPGRLRPGASRHTRVPVRGPDRLLLKPGHPETGLLVQVRAAKSAWTDAHASRCLRIHASANVGVGSRS